MSIQPFTQSTAMPAQKFTPLPPGANSPMSAGIITQQNQAKNQMTLIGAGLKRRIRGGGAQMVQVPPVPSGAPNSSLTGSNYKDLTQLAQNQQSQAVYDKAQNPDDTALIQQQTLSGGSLRGGYWPKWECLSGGRKSRNCKKLRNCKKKSKNSKKGKKSRKNRRTIRRQK
uniref:Uncharacterized protein n=1 Tax=viral metagenome TaxID=1070528 RepID=A0A6C0KMA0_9ZZZZ